MGFQRNERTVVFLPRHATSWLKMTELARIFATDGRFEPVFLVTQRAIAECAPKDLSGAGRVLDVSARIERMIAATRAAAGDSISAAANGGAEGGEISPRAEWQRMRGYSRDLGAWAAELDSILAELAPAAVMLPGDRELEPVPPALFVCRQRRIPSVICVSSLPNIEAVRLSRAGNPAFDAGPDAGWLNRWARKFRPGQVDTSGGPPMLFSPGWRILALARAGMLSANPWVQGGGMSDFVLHHSRSRLDAAIAQGLAPRKAVFVGDQTLDPLYRAFQGRDAARTKLLRKYGLNAGRRVCVFSVPNDAEHGLCDMATHLTRLNAWMAPLAARPLHVLVSLHPKSSVETYADLARRHGFTIVDERLSDLLPAGDVFVCGCSSTIHWAQLCGVPVLNIDWVPYRSAHFTAPFGILTAETPDEFLECIDRYLGGEAEIGLPAHSERVRADSLFDGMAGTRIADFVLTLDGERA